MKVFSSAAARHSRFTVVLVFTATLTCMAEEKSHFGKTHNHQPYNSFQKPRFIPRSMTQKEYTNLKLYIDTRLSEADEAGDQRLIKKYHELQTLLNELHHKAATLANKKDETIYTQYFNLVIAELESLGHNPQAILNETGLRIKLLQGQLDRSWFLIKEIASIPWQFEHDAEQKRLHSSKNGTHSLITPYRSPWPKTQDKAWYIITLVDQLYRNHANRATDQEVENALLILDTYLVEFLPQVSSIVTRSINQARSKLETIREQRSVR